MPAPHDPPHRHRTPGPRLLGLVLLTALALAAAMIRWANDSEIANPDFIAWAVSGTEHHVDGFTLTELDLEGWLSTSSDETAPETTWSALTRSGASSTTPTTGVRTPPTVPLRADAGPYEHLADHHRAIAAYCSPPRTTATSTWSRRTVYTNSCSTLRRGGWLDENALPPSVNWDPHGG